MSWIAELTVKRICQNTCVYFIDTKDKARTDQGRNWAIKAMKAKNGEEKLAFTEALEFDIQRQELLDIGNKLTPLDPATLPEIDKHLLNPNGKTLVIIHNAFLQSHADSLSDYLAAWAHDGRIFNNGGTIMVFTADVSLFHETLRELCYTITLYPPSTDDERLQVMQQVVQNLKDNLNPVNLKKLDLKISPEAVDQSKGLSPSEVQTATMESLRTLGKIDVSKFTEIKIAKFHAQDREFIVSSTGFEAIGGYDYAKTLIRNTIAAPLKDPAKAVRYGIKLPRGILLVGPPGTGKTLFALALAKEIGWPMVKVIGADLYKPHVGESEAAMRQLSREVEANAPCAIFIDEIDALLPSRGKVMMTDSGVNRRITNGILDYLGDPKRQAFVIGASNCIDDIDDAALRPGRFDYIVPIFYPDLNARMQIIDIQCTVRNHIPIDETVKNNYAELAKLSFMMSGADIEKWCLDTARYGMEKDEYPICLDHFKEIRKWMDINIQERQADLERLAEALKKLKSGVNKKIMEQAVAEFARGEGGDVADRLKAFTEGFGAKAVSV